MDIEKERALDAARRDIDAALMKIAEGKHELAAAARRARDAGMGVTEIAARASVTRPTIYSWTDAKAAD